MGSSRIDCATGIHRWTLTPDFYAAAGYYFDGVWSNVTEAERTLMRVLARSGDRPEQPGGGWTAEGLAAATGQTAEEVSAALDLLRRHDVIVEEAGGVRFASELMRRWVERTMTANQGD